MDRRTSIQQPTHLESFFRNTQSHFLIHTPSLLCVDQCRKKVKFICILWLHVHIVFNSRLFCSILLFCVNCCNYKSFVCVVVVVIVVYHIESPIVNHQPSVSAMWCSFISCDERFVKRTWKYERMSFHPHRHHSYVLLGFAQYCSVRFCLFIDSYNEGDPFLYSGLIIALIVIPLLLHIIFVFCWADKDNKLNEFLQ